MIAQDIEPQVRKIEELPREVGVMLMSVGVLGVVLPGLAGAPALVAGGLILWPKTFRGLDRWIQREYPSLHQQSLTQIGRYLDDMERRYPDPTVSKSIGEPNERFGRN